MKLSEAIRKGSKNTKQAYGTFFEINRKGKRHKKPTETQTYGIKWLWPAGGGIATVPLGSTVYDEHGIPMGTTTGPLSSTAEQ